MMRLLLQDLGGQHVYLATDDASEFYRTLGFTERGIGMEKIIGIWLENA